MPFVMPPTMTISAPRPGPSLSGYAAARMTPATTVGQTLFRDADGWHQGRLFSQRQLNAASIVLLGGHWTWIDEDTYDEIIDAGFVLSVRPVVAGEGAYPSSLTFPSLTLYPGAA